MTDPARPAGEGSGETSPFPAAYGSLGSSPSRQDVEERERADGEPSGRRAAGKLSAGQALRRAMNRRRSEADEPSEPAVGSGQKAPAGLGSPARPVASSGPVAAVAGSGARGSGSGQGSTAVRSSASSVSPRASGSSARSATPELTSEPGSPRGGSGGARTGVRRGSLRVAPPRPEGDWAPETGRGSETGRAPVEPGPGGPGRPYEPEREPSEPGRTLEPGRTEPGPARHRPDRTLPDNVARQVGREYAPDSEIAVGAHHWWQRRRKVTVVRARSSRRLIRRLDTWTVFKVSFLFYVLMLVVVLVAGLVAWRVAIQVGFVNDIQKAVRSLADDRKFKLHGNVAFKYTAIGGAVLVIAGTLLNVVASMLYNLLSDLVGGIQAIVISEPD